VIDSLRAGKSSGGIRISEHIDEAEIRAMAHSMSLKYRILHRRMGGAKCGIHIPKECGSEQRNEILKSFGAQASDILQKRMYIPYMDMNCTQQDINTILTAANTSLYKISDSSYYTALSVVASINAASTYQQRTLENRSVIIEGFGNVGSHIASELRSYGVRVVGISTEKGAIYHHQGFPITELLKNRKNEGDNVVNMFPEYWIEPKELLLEQPCDILIPCARYHSLHQDNMELIQTKIISPGANNPYDTGVESYLFDEGVICLPDFVTNVGGILGTSLYDNGVSLDNIHRFFDEDYSVFIKELIHLSHQIQRTPGDIARMIAESGQQVDNTPQLHSEKQNHSNQSFVSKMIKKLPNDLQQQYHILLERRRMRKNMKDLKEIGKNQR